MSLSDPFLIANLISKSLLEKLNKEEQALLTEWLEESPENRKVFDRCTNERSLKADLHYFDTVNVDNGWNEVVHKISGEPVKEPEPNRRYTFPNVFNRYRRWGIAAVVVLSGMIAGIIFDSNIKRPQNDQFSINYKNDVLPGGKVAQLILSDGSIVDLKENSRGFTERDGSLINAVAGNLDYSKVDKKDSGDDDLYNTVKVPKGGNYEITLADGTNVLLNSESELRFPVHFSESIREVHLKGEGYFSVSKDKKRPFSVKANGSTIEVLGTEFNVNLYTETVQTTLVEGSVKLQQNKLSRVLRPGELGNVNSKDINIEKADLRKVLAWKNKEFYFRGDEFQDVLSQLALWYDLDVKVDPELANLKISGSIDKDVKLSEVILMLKFVANCHFELQGKLLTVTKSKSHGIK